MLQVVHGAQYEAFGRSRMALTFPAKVFCAILRSAVEILAAEHPAAENSRGYQPEADKYFYKQITAQHHVSIIAIGNGELVAHATHADNQVFATAGRQFFTDFTDMNVNT